jgi:hypothetical protein
VILVGRVLFSLVWALAGLYLATLAIRLYQRRRDLLLYGVTANGEVVALETVSGKRQTVTPYLAPVIVFMPNAGAPWKFRASTARRVNPYVVGQHVTVRYLPYNLETADIDGDSTGWGTFVIIVFAMVVTFAVASLPIILKPPAPR